MRSLIMADREQPHTSPRGADEKRQRDVGGKVGQPHGSGQREREPSVKSGGTVGRDVPDQSKEHNTEIAVEAGREGVHPENQPVDSKR
jgi:hypothetical protein